MRQIRWRDWTRFVEVDLHHVRLSLGERVVLRDINWRIRPGQRWVLTGANGAGKTQLLKLLAGDVWPSPHAGSWRRYRLAGERFDDPYGIRDELSYLGAERQDRYQHYEWNHSVERIVATGLHRTDIPLEPLSADDRRRVAALLSRLRLDALRHRRFLDLSYGERRLVLLVRAIAARPRLLLLDELFSGLDGENRARVAQTLTQLSQSPLPWVLSTHRPEEVPECATHVCCIEAGRIIRRGRVRQGAARRAALRAVRARAAAPLSVPPMAKPSTRREALLRLRRASVWRSGARVLQTLSFELQRGDCWLVHGANGSGKSTLIQLLHGDLGAARGGALWRAGIEPGVPLQSFQRRVGLVAPELQALQPLHLVVEQLVASGLHASVGLNAAMRARERRLVQRALRRVGATTLARRSLRALSYGQLRRVLFARALVNEPDILLLDEPYGGLDIDTRAALRRLVERAIAGGITTVMTSHHRDEWPLRATHELELTHGRASYCGPRRRR